MFVDVSYFWLFDTLLWNKVSYANEHETNTHTTLDKKHRLFTKGKSIIFVVSFGIPLFSQKKIDLRMKNICIHRSKLTELLFNF